jgi:spore maturation protein CgeB
LLIKPDMSHMATTPNIFINGETYVSVKWDFSDFNEKVHYYLNNESERNRITRNAFEVCSDYIVKDGFLAFFERLVEPVS